MDIFTGSCQASLNCVDHRKHVTYTSDRKWNDIGKLYYLGKANQMEKKTYRISKIENVRMAGKRLTQQTELKQAHISLWKTEQLLDRYGQSVLDI